MSVAHDDDEITVASFVRWLKVARRGEVFTYHRGHLASDRMDISMLPSLGTFVTQFHEPAHELGLTAYHHSSKGDVALTQKRLPDGRGFAYLATKL